MGFRNQITSAVASETDTGQPKGAGVRVYQDESGAWPRGLVEHRSGVAGEDPATLALTVFRQTNPDGFVRVYGRRYSLDGGSSNGVDAPSVDLEVQELPAGGYGPYAFLRGAPRGFEPLWNGVLQLNTAKFVPYNTAYTPKVRKLADGLVVVDGAVKMIASVGAGETIGWLHPSCWPRAGGSNPVFAMMGGNDRLWKCDVSASDGRVILGGVVSADWSGPLNSYLSLYGLHWLADD